ncbi:MAG: DNA polymerase III subunit alpha [Elusimicrobiota bacterium]
MSIHTEFVHLHNHTEYSLLDGACRVVNDKDEPGDLLHHVLKNNMKALAITDHGNMYGAVEFYLACKKIGLKPVIGCEVYVAPQSRFMKRVEVDNRETAFHLTLLAQNFRGYQNLMKLVTLGFLEGFYYHPRVDRELIEKYHDGIIALSGCLKGEVPNLLLKGKDAEAVRLAGEYSEIFGKENYFVELMDHGIEKQRIVLPKLVALGKKCNLPLVCTNDCHYLSSQDVEVHEVLLCIGTKKTMMDADRFRFSSPQFYYKTPEEMRLTFRDYPDAIRNTVVIAERVNVEIDTTHTYLPEYALPPGEVSLEAYLRKLCVQGIAKRYPPGSDLDRVHKRLEHELGVVGKMGFAGYFLIVWDFISYAKSKDIPVGPGRGSGAGSIISFLLGITEIEPLKYNLLFERFLNSERISMPDLDIDFSDHGREEVINYVKNKYGEDSVAQIITFSTMQSKLVTKDVGRALGVPLEHVETVTKLFPTGMSVAAARNSVADIRSIAENNAQISKMLDIAQKLEGVKRHVGVHAAGVVISKGDIVNYVPLAKQPNKDAVTTQYYDKLLEKLGLLKMDFLGLRTLSILQDTLKLIVQTRGVKVDLSAIELNDKKTFQLFKVARTIGVFQLESQGMRNVLRDLQPTEFEDIIALNAMFRPGPLKSGMVRDYIERKHKRAKVVYYHPKLEPVLRETYGVILYQEQVMQISMVLAGFSAAQADILRHAMGKKNVVEIAKQKNGFIEGCKKNGHAGDFAKDLFEKIEFFAGYGFNKSHATAYALVAYWTAYLKANFTLEYFAALLTSEIGRSAIKEGEENKIAEYTADAKLFGLEILAPSVQKSYSQFSVEDNKIRYGLLAIKNVGEGAVETIVEERRKNGEYKNWDDFLYRIDMRQVNRRMLESLVKSGACDCFGRNRSELYASLDVIVDRVVRLQRKKDAGAQVSLFGDEDILSYKSEDTMAEMPEWVEHVLLSNEKEVLGLYVSGHPLATRAAELLCYAKSTIGEIKKKYQKIEPDTETVEEIGGEIAEGDNNGIDGKEKGGGKAKNGFHREFLERIRIGGLVSNVMKLNVKATGEPWAKIKLEDLTDDIEVLVFPRYFRVVDIKCLELNAIVIVEGTLQRGDNSIDIIADEIHCIGDAVQRYVNRVWLTVDNILIKEEKFLERLRKLVVNNPGPVRVGFKVHEESDEVVQLDLGVDIKLNDHVIKELCNMAGGNKNIEYGVAELTPEQVKKPRSERVDYYKNKR